MRFSEFFRRKRDHLIYAGLVGKEHDQPVHAKGDPSRVRHVVQGSEKFLGQRVHRFALLPASFSLTFKPLPLFMSISKLGKGIGFASIGEKQNAKTKSSPSGEGETKDKVFTR